MGPGLRIQLASRCVVKAITRQGSMKQGSRGTNLGRHLRVHYFPELVFASPGRLLLFRFIFLFFGDRSKNTSLFIHLFHSYFCLFRFPPVRLGLSLQVCSWFSGLVMLI